MKILPVLRSVIPFVTTDDTGKVTVHRLPLQVFRSGSATIVRIGENALFFEEGGKFDGFEAALRSPDDATLAAYDDASEESEASRGMPPAAAYFMPGTTGHTAETRAWPRGDAPSRGVEPSDPYVVAYGPSGKKRN